MFAFKKVFASVFLVVLCASTASAVPYPASSKFATRRSRVIGRDFKLETFHPESSYEVRAFRSYVRNCTWLPVLIIFPLSPDLRGWY